MSEQPVYRFTKTRRQQAVRLVSGAVVCWAYIGGALLYEDLSGQALPQELRFWGAVGLSVASGFSLLAALWCYRNPAEYVAEVTPERLVVKHPGHAGWCFDVAVSDIKRFEYRRTYSPGGEGTLRHGVLLHDGEFHHINMNYGVSLKKLFKAVRHVNPSVTFRSKVNKRFAGGPIERDFEG